MRMPLFCALLVSAVATVVLTGCSPTTEGQATSSASASSVPQAIETPTKKPRIAHLTEELLLPESGFPSGGSFHLSPIRTDSDLPPSADKCDLNSFVQNGDQETAANTITGGGNELRYGVELFATQHEQDLDAWKKNCVPRTDGRTTTQSADVQGIPPWAVSVEIVRSNSKKTMYSVIAYYRGLLVSASVSGNKDDISEDAQSALVRMFNKQIDRLEAH